MTAKRIPIAGGKFVLVKHEGSFGWQLLGDMETRSPIDAMAREIEVLREFVSATFARALAMSAAPVPDIIDNQTRQRLERALADVQALDKP